MVDYKKPDLKSKIFGHTYDAPFGISPVGLQGLMWPKSPEILAKAAFDHNIPFILSTVTTASIEKISEITEGRSWFQLYHPAEEKVTKDIFKELVRHNTSFNNTCRCSFVWLSSKGYPQWIIDASKNDI